MVWSGGPTFVTQRKRQQRQQGDSNPARPAGRIVAKHYARQHLLPRDVVQAHERGDIHYHDLDYFAVLPDVQLHVD